MAGLPTQIPPGLVPQGGPPGAGPTANMNPAQMAPQPARPPAPPQPPMGGMNVMTMLAFLAGAGLDNVTRSISKLQTPQGHGAARQHQAGIRLDASNNPAMTIAPLLAKLLAAQQAGVPQGNPPPPGPGVAG